MFYNAGIDPDARDLSPGVILAARYVQLALEAGRSAFDFLRGDEPYKYEWGAVDEPIQRLLVRRDARPAESDRLMGAPPTWDPCLVPLEHSRPARPGPGPRRRDPRDGHERRRPGAPVLADDAGSTRPTTTRRSSRCPAAAPSASSSATASTSPSSTTPTTPPRSRALAAHLALVRPDVIHTHMYRADVVGTKAAMALQAMRSSPAVRRLDRPLVARPLRARTAS